MSIDKKIKKRGKNILKAGLFTIALTSFINCSQNSEEMKKQNYVKHFEKQNLKVSGYGTKERLSKDKENLTTIYYSNEKGEQFLFTLEKTKDEKFYRTIEHHKTVSFNAEKHRNHWEVYKETLKGNKKKF